MHLRHSINFCNMDFLFLFFEKGPKPLPYLEKQLSNFDEKVIV